LPLALLNLGEILLAIATEVAELVEFAVAAGGNHSAVAQ